MFRNFDQTINFSKAIETDVTKTGFAPSDYTLLYQFSSLMLHKKSPQIYKVDKSLVNLLFNTKNQIFPRKMPHNSIFLNLDFKFNKLDIRGMLISSLPIPENDVIDEYWHNVEHFSELMEDPHSALLVDKRINKFYKEGSLNPKLLEKDPEAFFKKLILLGQKEMGDDLANYQSDPENLKNTKLGLFIFAWGIDGLDNGLFFAHKDILPPLKTNVFGEKHAEERKKLSKSYYEEFTLEMNDIDKFGETIELFVCNLLDFINNPEVKIVNHPTDEARNKKRIKRGKSLIPNYNDIRITGELRKYIEKSEVGNVSQKRVFDHKYWVSGHFRRFWDKEKYKNMYKKHQEKQLSLKYYYDDVNDVLMTWIVPFVKGKGMLVSKPHLLKKPGKKG